MHSKSINFLFQSFSSLSGVGEAYFKKLKRLLESDLNKDLLFHLPSSYIKRRVVNELTQDVIGENVILHTQILKHVVPSLKKYPHVIEGLWKQYPIKLVFFHAYSDFLKNKYKINETYWISGKLEYTSDGLRIVHPDYGVKDLKEIPTIDPQYPLTFGVKSSFIHHQVSSILHQVSIDFDWQDTPLISFQQALEEIHTPTSFEREKIARKRLAYDELLANQLALQLTRFCYKRAAGKSEVCPEKLWLACLKTLPFSLTKAQERVIQEIKEDMESAEKMNRLLQGDVGSGKTIVAISAILNAVEMGGQVALMVPTDILARQHFNTIIKLIKPLNISCVLLTARESTKVKKCILDEIKQGSVQVVIGTHALISEKVVFNNLRLAIVDEQHKFGVQQRLELIKKGVKTDLLAMTATPIPRTLALASYGDMDISYIDEKPKNRVPIETFILHEDKLDEIIIRIKEQLKTEDNLQIYWVCPLVQESEKLDLIAAEKRYENLKEFFGERVALIHGKMKTEEKEEIMQNFINGRSDILVSTTVIEVGVDVKNARIMVIEHAERFGLASLHQLRGRIGRGGGESKCLLVHAKALSKNAKSRLSIMKNTDNGFLIAEEDLRLRGAGEVLGVRQSGFQNFKIASLEEDGPLLEKATKEAKEIIKKDPFLLSQKGMALRMLLRLFSKENVIHYMNAG